ncbi:MFS transporter [Mesorhizobium sp. YIM 152430]|uniref:MFS transporter n=1 Tax=Mesorhizobium sp. YIM 152430 TaxID=3031761 RepID=UPI0023DC3584|nr:MFS transporter [Mesorhizobium sp. YIM 152430]MDF1598728.1 MFS transporter [Mesorhizobium sp. YIM 152430]
MHSLPDRPLRLVAIVLLLLTGVLTGAQLAKTAPLIGWYVETIGMTLVEAGWVTALIGIFVALAALPAGFAIARIGPQRAFVVASAIIVPGGLILAATTAPSLIFAARMIEGLGYVILCVGLPSLLTAISPSGWRGPVLAIWSGFVPLGYATSDVLAGLIVPVLGTQSYLLGVILLFAAMALASQVVLRWLTGVPADAVFAPEGASSVFSVGVLLVALAFGAFVLQSVALFTFMPTFAALPGAFLFAPALVALSTPLGNGLAGLLVAGRAAPFMIVLALAAFVVTALAAYVAFVTGGAAAASFGAVAMAIASGVVASALFAVIPFLVSRPQAVPAAIGLVSQAGGLATLASPPLAAFIIERAGWTGYGWFLGLTGLAGAAMLIPLALGPLIAAGRRQTP